MNEQERALMRTGGIRLAYDEREENDFYATDPKAAEWLLKIEPEITDVWEPFVGTGNLAEPYREASKLRIISDLIDRGYYPERVSTSYGKDFLKMNKIWKGDIVSNPPYKGSLKYVKHCLDLVNEGHYVALFLRLNFLETLERYKFFKKYPPIRVWIPALRIVCARDNEFMIPATNRKTGEVLYDKEGNIKYTKRTSAVCSCWYIWKKGYTGETVLKWFNNGKKEE